MTRITKLCADSWFRFLIKQTYKTLRPKRSFTEYNPAGVPIHGPKTILNGWEWFGMGFFLHWKPSQTTTVLCFDTLDKLQSLLGSASRWNGINFDTADPYSLLSPLMDQVIALYDESVWSMRNHVCAAEAVRFSESRWNFDLGTSFFNYQPANGGGESFTVSNRFWVY